jgi:monoterpene epsilon-lactone hydrolase
MRLPLKVVAGVQRRIARPVFGDRVPIAVQRRVADGLMAAVRVPRGVPVQDVVLAGRPTRRYGGTGSRAILWAHGGAFITGSYRTHGPFAARLALATGCPVYLVDYRLAPEHPHPAALHDVLGALDLVPEPTVLLGGDSAGGALALLAAAATTRPLAGLALVSPMVDLTLASSSAWEGEDVLIQPSWGQLGLASMFGGNLPEIVDPTVPTIVHVAEHERLRPEGEALAARIGAETYLVPDGWHDIHLQAGVVTVGDRALQVLADSISGLLRAPKDFLRTD